jgi:ferrous iron transport protein B
MTPLRPRILLIGTPNSGKTTLFNRLTGLHHHTANLPGVTTTVSEGSVRLPGNPCGCSEAACLDLPGIYSLYPDTPDEVEAVRCLREALAYKGPQCVVFVADPTTPLRTLHLLTHLLRFIHIDLVVFNFWDVAEKEGLHFDEKSFRRLFGPLRYAFHNPRNHVHIRQIKAAISEILCHYSESRQHPLLKQEKVPPPELRIAESTAVYEKLHAEEARVFYRENAQEDVPFTLSRWDKILLHPFWGMVIFMGILFVIFQSIFTWSALPMAWIENFFTAAGLWVQKHLPEGALTDLFADGVLQGLSGILVFVPQIAFLLFFIAVLEESGYMARAVALMDRFMRRFGLSGRSVVPLLGGAACAVPSILATRSIPHPVHRLITILVIPLMSCSARLPVYTMLLGLLLPEKKIAGMDIRGLALMGMYGLGFALAVGSAWILSRLVKTTGRDYLIMSLPHLQKPHVGVVVAKAWNGLREFVLGAGKIILLISIILWGLLNFGPEGKTSMVEMNGETQFPGLEQSWAAIIGRTMEPVLEPMGGDWRIGIALISSFAAREVFSGTIATLYPPPPGSALRTHLKSLRREDGRPVFSSALCISLLIFYALALQCMSTLATVYYETRSVKWPLLQFFVLIGAAWLAATAAYQMVLYVGY